MPTQDMNKFVPIIALALVGVGWCWTAWTNRQLRRRLRQLEQEAKARKETAAAEDVAPSSRFPEPLPPTAESEYDELAAQYDSAKRELEAQEQARLLGAEDQHLAVLKAELEALRADLQSDLESLADEISGAWSGLSTPATAGSTANGPFDCGASEGGESAAPSEPRSPALGSPSPKRACSSSSVASELGYLPSAPPSTATLSAPTSGAATPLSPRSPHRFDFDDGAEDDWLSTDGGDDTEGPLTSPRRPVVAVAPPLPPLALAPPAGGLEAALRAAFESDGMTEDEWENEEEWLMPTARTVRPLPPVTRAGSAPAAPPGGGNVRKQVKVPRLNLARAGGGGVSGSSVGDGKSGASTPGTAKVTISARGGITGRPKTARGGPKQQPGTSRLGGGAGGSPSPLKSARGAAPAVQQPSWNFSTKTKAPERALDSPPALFPRGGGATARRDAPTPRLVAAPSASSPLRRSPSQLSRADSTDSSQASQGTKIPRLVLPAAQQS